MSARSGDWFSIRLPMFHSRPHLFLLKQLGGPQCGLPYQYNHILAFIELDLICPSLHIILVQNVLLSFVASHFF